MKNFGFKTPLVPPPPSQYSAPLPSNADPGSPLTVILLPLTENKGPAHSLYSNVVLPRKMTLTNVSSNYQRSYYREVLTVVPSFRPSKFNVLPAGTVSADSTIVEHVVLVAFAAA